MMMMMMIKKKEKNVAEKIVRSKKNNDEGLVPKKNKDKVLDRFLITINIMGSAGPIRFVVKEKELVSNVIDIALKSYAREGRLPVLGFDCSNFILYCANATFDGRYGSLAFRKSIYRYSFQFDA